MLWVHSLGTNQTRRLADLVGGGVGFFWSPDSRSIGFATQNTLRTLDVSGGPAQTVCKLAGVFRGGAWSRDGVIIFGTVGGGLMQVRAAGGTPSPLTISAGSSLREFHGQPAFLPDGRHFIYQRRALTLEDSGIFVGSLDAQPDQQDSRRLLNTDSPATYAPTPGKPIGHVLFRRDGALMAQPFDPAKRVWMGEAAAVASDVRPAGTGLDPGAEQPYAASGNGVLVYRAGAAEASDTRLLWYDRSGKQLGQLGPAADYSSIQLSADGRKIAVVILESEFGRHVWTADVSRGVFSRLNPGDTRDSAPSISVDGRVAFSSSSNGAIGDIYATQVSGGDPEAWVKSEIENHPNHFSTDSRYLIYDAHHPVRRQDLWILPLGGKRAPIPFLTTAADETFGQFSTDGKWIAYSSDESRRREVYIQGFAADRTPAATGGKWRVSTEGGDKPRWRADGKELYYIAPDGKMMAVPVKTGPTIELGNPVALFDTNVVGFFPYDVSPDGRFLLNTAAETTGASSPLTVVLNWQARLKE